MWRRRASDASVAQASERRECGAGELATQVLSINLAFSYPLHSFAELMARSAALLLLISIALCALHSPQHRSMRSLTFPPSCTPRHPNPPSSSSNRLPLLAFQVDGRICARESHQNPDNATKAHRKILGVSSLFLVPSFCVPWARLGHRWALFGVFLYLF